MNRPVIKAEILVPHPDSLSVFIDETGQEEFVDLNSPFFGVGGCAQISRYCDATINKPWKKLRTAHFGDVSGPLHAAELNSKLTPTQQAALGEFFTTQKFYRPAVISSQDTTKPDDMKTVESVVVALLGKIQAIWNLHECHSLIVIIEDTQRLRAAFMDAFDKHSILGRDGRPIETNGVFIAKSRLQPGLEVADFVMNATLGQVRARRKGSTNVRKDFESIFNQYPQPVELMDVSRSKSRQ